MQVVGAHGKGRQNIRFEIKYGRYICARNVWKINICDLFNFPLKETKLKGKSNTYREWNFFITASM